MQSRNSKTSAEEEYTKIVDRQRKRKGKLGGGSVDVCDEQELT